MRIRQEWLRKQKLLAEIEQHNQKQNEELAGPTELDPEEVELVEEPKPPPLPILVTESMLKPPPLPTGFGTDRHFKKGKP